MLLATYSFSDVVMAALLLEKRTYLIVSYDRKVAPGKLKTVIRHPIRRKDT